MAPRRDPSLSIMHTAAQAWPDCLSCPSQCAKAWSLGKSSVVWLGVDLGRLQTQRPSPFEEEGDDG